MKAKIVLIITLLVFSLAGPAVVPAGIVQAACNDTTSKKEVVEALGQASRNACSDNGVSNLVHTIVSILSYVVGVVAIIMILASGFKYITSGGDSAKVSSAKSTLIYALIGIAVAVLAQLLVRFVITQANGV
jgi:hypothetical protein